MHKIVAADATVLLCGASALKRVRRPPRRPWAEVMGTCITLAQSECSTRSAACHRGATRYSRKFQIGHTSSEPELGAGTRVAITSQLFLVEWRVQFSDARFRFRYYSGTRKSRARTRGRLCPPPRTTRHAQYKHDTKTHTKQRRRCAHRCVER